MNFDRTEVINAIIEPIRQQNRAQQEQLRIMEKRQAEAMSELVSDPRWANFQSHIEAVLKFHRAKVEALEAILTRTLTLSDAEKLELSKHRGWAEAMAFTTRFVFELIEKGNATVVPEDGK